MRSKRKQKMLGGKKVMEMINEYNATFSQAQAT
jgi:hypothetical protein